MLGKTNIIYLIKRRRLKMANEIVKLVPTIMGLGLLGENVKELKKKKPNFVKLAVEDTIGMALISETSNFLK
jgi:hypothetical protein